MPAQRISADELRKSKPSAHCCYCSRSASTAPPTESWVIWNGTMIYCPQCAKKDGADDRCLQQGSKLVDS
jgi:hypothetical protein